MAARLVPATGTRIQAETRSEICLADRSIHATLRGDTGKDAERDRGGKVFGRKRWGAGHVDEWCGAVDCNEREVARRGADQSRTEHVPREVVLVRDLEREDRTRGRGFEDRGDTGSGARDEQQPAVLRGEQPGEAVLERVADGRTKVERRALEAHGGAAPQRCDPRDHPRPERPKRKRVLRVVERVQVLVRCRGRARRTDPTQRERRDAQPEQRRARNPPQRKPVDLLQPARNGTLETGDTNSCEHTDDRRQHQGLSRSSAEITRTLAD